MIKIILDKYRQLTIGFLQVRPSKHFRDQPKSSIRKVSSLIKLETLSKKKPPNRHSPERSQTQPKYLSILSIDKYLSILSIDKYLSISSYTSWELSLISIYRTYTIIKNSTDIAKAATTMSVFYFGFKKIQKEQIFIHRCQRTPNLGSFISYRISAVFFGLRIWQKSYSTTSKVISKNSFSKKLFHYGGRQTVGIFVDSIINF